MRGSSRKPDPARKPDPSRTGDATGKSDVTPDRRDEGGVLLSDEPTIELVVRAQDGDRRAVEALLQRSLPHLRRWAHGKLPPAARSKLDTGDLVQETVLHLLRRLDTFEPRHVGAMQGYLRQSVMNLIRDEVRRIGRHPAPSELRQDMPSDLRSPYEEAVRAEDVYRYHVALAQLPSRDRELVVARIEAQWTYEEIATRFGMPSPDAARMAVTRALKRLMEYIRKVEQGKRPRPLATKKR
jgi:RNA polymerase sigma-70 factor (ECF subfamily)